MMMGPVRLTSAKILLIMSDNDSEHEWISKSQKKRDCHALQKISDRLLKLKRDELALIDLPAELEDAIKETQRIRSNSALKRQRQYLGKIMRSVDSDAIEQQLNRVLHRNDTNTAQFRKIEKWRDRLIENDKEVLGEIIQQLPDVDRHHLHNLVRQAAKESKEQKPPAAARKLFRYLKDVVSESNRP
jgi:ribosome-associated protein